MLLTLRTHKQLINWQ